MGLFGKSYDWKACLSQQEVDDTIRFLEEMVHRDRFAMGFQPDEVKKGILERKTALQLLKTKRKLSESEVDLVCSCLRKEIAYRQMTWEGLEEVRTLNNLAFAFSRMKSK